MPTVRAVVPVAERVRRPRVEREAVKDLRELILGAAHDAGTDFMVYSRKGDEELTQLGLYRAIEDGTVTVDEIVSAFTAAVREEL